MQGTFWAFNRFICSQSMLSNFDAITKAKQKAVKNPRQAAVVKKVFRQDLALGKVKLVLGKKSASCTSKKKLSIKESH